MQGRRSSVGSLPDILGFDHGSSPSEDHQQICWNNMQNSIQSRIASEYSPGNTYMSPMTGEEQNLSGWNLGEPGSSTDLHNHNERKTKHGWTSSEVVPRFTAPPNNFLFSSGNQIPNVHAVSESGPVDLNMISSGFAEPDSPDCQIISPPSSSRNTRLPSSSNSSDPSRLSLESSRYLVEGNGNNNRKRKAVEGTVGQSSSASGSSNYYEGSAGVYHNNIQPRRNASQGLSISPPSEPLLNLNQGLGLAVSSASPVPISAPLGGESSSSRARRNLRMRFNMPQQQDSTPVFPQQHHSSSRLLPVNLMTPPQLSAQTVTPAPRPTQQASRWNRGGSIPRPVVQNPGVSASIVEDPSTRTIPRSISEHPMFVPAAGGMRASGQNPINLSINGGGNGGSTSAVRHPSSSFSAAPFPHRNNGQPYPRRLVEMMRRSLLMNGSSESGGGQSSNSILPPQAISGQQGAHNRHLSQPRAGLVFGDRQVDGGTTYGIPYSMATLPAEGGRNRLMSEHIRNVLDIMRRGEGLRMEDVMLLDQSVFFGMGDIHDRHRDMRLDVDNMSYEELLALEERIGNVNTGLTEETILTRLKTRKCIIKSCETDETEVEPCCVCQEEYKSGDDLGKLECGHDFHTDCIKQWLMQKNLCPICKTTALVV
jgi:E3 ubiquitin-protein ligase Arkadia